VFDHAGLGDYNNYVKIDPRYLRPSEVPCLLGDAKKAQANLDWEPKVNMEELAALMYEADLNLIKGE
jgi:GDPmannose 4,6-dehydratase